MINVYIKKWSKKDGPWQHILADILEKDYKIKETPQIEKNEMGKPYFTKEDLQFNVSHTDEYLAFAISDSLVGIDIQGKKRILESTFQRVVQPRELCLIGEDKQKDFLRLWALKESFLKAEGMGLRISFKDYWFEKEDGKYFVNYGGQRCGWTFNIEETLVEDVVICVCGLEQKIQWILI